MLLFRHFSLNRSRYVLWLCVIVLSGCSGGRSGSQSLDSGPSPGSGTAVDSESPVVAITSPQAPNGAYISPGATLTLVGTASDSVGVARVVWRNNTTGATGSSQGTSHWDANITLVLGTNPVVVTAYDAAGNSGTASMTVMYLPTGQPTLSGQVDSSLINRSGSNAVYVYVGNVIPDDQGGTGAQPYATVPVVQDNNACTWSYQLGSLPAGQYTVAFTNSAGSDQPNIDDAIGFTGTTGLTVQPGQAAANSFPALRVLQVGPGRTYARPGLAAAVARDGDTIEIDALVYDDDIVVWRRNNLTLRGVGGRAHVRATRLIPFTSGNDQQNGKGIWVLSGRNTTVENMEFSGARVDDKNGAGIRADGPDLTVCNSSFHDNENGILGGGNNVLIEYSEFAYNGGCEPGFGCSHNMYISGDTNRFTLRYSTSHHAKIGHAVKSRAKENRILYNRLMDERTGTSSYIVDLPNGGLSYLVGNLLQQGPDTDNSTIVAYGAEGLSNPKNELYFVNNTVANDFSGGVFVSTAGGTTVFKAANNLFVGSGTVFGGKQPTEAASNLVTPSPALFDRSNYDYRLTAASPARDAGRNPGFANGFDLAPVSHYVHPAHRQDRPLSAPIDIGAYEYVP